MKVAVLFGHMNEEKIHTNVFLKLLSPVMPHFKVNMPQSEKLTGDL